MGKKKRNVETEKQVGIQLEQRVERVDMVFLQETNTNRERERESRGKEKCDSLS